jgi:trans-aconitate methyltransferase
MWWSRVYEYRWLKDVVEAIATPVRRVSTAVDVGCGMQHPGCFLLARSGFGRAIAQDVEARHDLLERINVHNLEYVRMDMTESVACEAQLVCCLSVLEHVPPHLQVRALRNLCSAVAGGGLLLLTFDMPGFEYDTNLDLYKNVLGDLRFEFIEVDVGPELRLTSATGPVSRPSWVSVGRAELECYRLLAWHRVDGRPDFW